MRKREKVNFLDCMLKISVMAWDTILGTTDNALHSLGLELAPPRVLQNVTFKPAASSREICVISEPEMKDFE